MVAITVLNLTLAACGSVQTYHDGPPATQFDVRSIPDPVPRVEPHSAYGNPRSYVVRGRRYIVMQSSSGYRERGIASWYGTKFHGRLTSSNEPYDMYAMSAAHKTLPLPTYVEVTNLDNGRRVVVRVNDRGPFKANRLIDLSYAAAIKLGMTRSGTALVEIRALQPGAPRKTAQTSPETTTAKTEKARLFLQVGAYSDRENAERMRQRIHRLVHSEVQVFAQGSQRDAMYQVRVGPLPSVQDADRMGAKLVLMGFDAPHIVID